MQKQSICAADHSLCFRYTDSAAPLLPEPEILRLYPFSLAVQPGLCLTWSETPIKRFLHDEAHFVAVIDSHDKTHVSMKDHFRGLSWAFR